MKSRLRYTGVGAGLLMALVFGLAAAWSDLPDQEATVVPDDLVSVEITIVCDKTECIRTDRVFDLNEDGVPTGWLEVPAPQSPEPVATVKQTQVEAVTSTNTIIGERRPEPQHSRVLIYPL